MEAGHAVSSGPWWGGGRTPPIRRTCAPRPRLSVGSVRNGRRGGCRGPRRRVAQDCGVRLTPLVATSDPHDVDRRRAPFTSLCDYCNAVIVRGQLVFRLPDGHLICARCSELAADR